VDADGGLWISLASPFTYAYDRDGNKRRTVQFHAAGVIAPTSLFFTTDGRLLVAPGCYAFSAK
jgi:sugar lactone lactonase YvrE